MKTQATDSTFKERPGQVLATRKRPASVACIQNRHEGCWIDQQIRDANYNLIENKCFCECHGVAP